MCPVTLVHLRMLEFYESDNNGGHGSRHSKLGTGPILLRFLERNRFRFRFRSGDAGPLHLCYAVIVILTCLNLPSWLRSARCFKILVKIQM